MPRKKTTEGGEKKSLHGAEDNIDFEKLALEDPEQFGKKAYEMIYSLRDRLANAVKLQETLDDMSTTTPELAARYDAIYEKLSNGEYKQMMEDVILAVNAVRAPADDDENRQAVLESAARAVKRLGISLREVRQLGFKEEQIKGIDPLPESSFEGNIRERLGGFKEEIENGRARLEEYRADHRNLKRSPKAVLFDREFVKRLDDFDRNISLAEKKMSELENDLGIVDVLLSDEKTPERKIHEKLSMLETKRSEAANMMKTVEKRNEKIKGDFETMSGSHERLNKISEKIVAEMTERDEKWLDKIPSGRTIARGLLAQAGKIRNEIKAGKKMPENVIEDFENEIEEKIFKPIAAAKEKVKTDAIAAHEKEIADKAEAARKAERVEEQKKVEKLARELRPAIKVEGDELGKMIDELSLAMNAIRHAPKSQAGKFIDSAVKSAADADAMNRYLEMVVKGEEEIGLEDLKEKIIESENLMKSARAKFPEAVKIAREILVTAIKNQLYVAELSKQYLTREEYGILKSLEDMLLYPENLSLSDIENIPYTFNEKVWKPIEEARKKGVIPKREEAGPEASIIPPPPEQSADELVKEAFAEEEIPIYVDEGGKEVRFTAEDVAVGLKEMLEREGVVDLSPQEILGALSPESVNTLINNVREDVMHESDGNSGEFKRILRESLGEKLLKALDSETRDKLGEAVAAQVYSLLKSAVNAEAQSEILKQQTTKIQKMARIGVVGANLAANIAVAVGIGVAAAAVIGSGGLAAPVAGAAIAGVRIGSKLLDKFAPVKKAKGAVSSFFGKLLNRFDKNKPMVDGAKVVSDTAQKIITPEMLSVILANQLRENSSENTVKEISAYSQVKSEILRHPSEATARKFESSLDKASKEFYKNSYNYLSVKFADKNLSEEALGQMALEMTLTLGVYQKNEIKVNEAARKNSAFADKVEKILKFRSDGVGAVLFGGGIAYAVAEQGVAGRVVSGALSGAGLGLMIEKKTRASEDRKVTENAEKSLTFMEKFSFKNAEDIIAEDWDKIQTQTAALRADFDAGKFDGENILKNRVENIISRVGRLTIERAKLANKTLDKILADVARQSVDYDKVAKKHEKKLFKIFGVKDRRTVFILAGAMVGAGVGAALGAGVVGKIRAMFGATPVVGKTIQFQEQDLGPVRQAAPGVSMAGYERFPLKPVLEPEAISPEQIEPEHIAPRVHRPSIVRPVEEIVKPASPISENPYETQTEPIVELREDKFTQELDRMRLRPLSAADKRFLHEFDKLMARPGKIDTEQYHKIIDVYGKAGMKKAAEYMHLLETGKPHEAELLRGVVEKLHTDDLLSHYGSTELDTTIDEKAIREDISAQIDEQRAVDLSASQGSSENISASEKDTAELVEEAKQRLQHEKSGAIVEKLFQSDVDRLGARDAYEWLKEQSQNYTLPDEEYDKAQELIGKFRAGVKAGKLPSALMREINREMTAHGI